MNCFNTDDGIRRAAISFMKQQDITRKEVSIPMTVLGGLQYQRLKTHRLIILSFNTDDGIRRAAIADVADEAKGAPMFQYR